MFNIMLELSVDTVYLSNSFAHYLHCLNRFLKAFLNNNSDSNQKLVF